MLLGYFSLNQPDLVWWQLNNDSKRLRLLYITVVDIRQVTSHYYAELKRIVYIIGSVRFPCYADGS